MKRKTMNDKPEQPQPPPPEQPAGSESGALIDPSEEAVVRLEGELADMKDKYLRLAAEYDNFKKRSVKERTELWQRAQADLIQRLVDALDDLARFAHVDPAQDRKSTRLNSSHVSISYAVFCLKKKTDYQSHQIPTPALPLL